MVFSSILTDYDVARIEKKLEVCFLDKSLLLKALTHASFANEFPSSDVSSNERLEFLGDSVLGLVATEAIFNKNQGAGQGSMTDARREIVRGETLAAAGRYMNLGRLILFGKGEQVDGPNKESNLEDAFEALVGAVFLDRGYFEARQFVLRWLDESLFKIDDPRAVREPKSALQQATQSVNGTLPVYNTRLREGREYFSEVWIEGKIAGTGYGSRKVKAEQAAASDALHKMFKRNSFWSLKDANDE